MHVTGQRALRVGLVDPDQRHGQPLRRRGVVPAVAALDAQPALRPGLVAALGERDGAAVPVDVVGDRAADAAVGADAVDGVELGARPDRHVVDRLVGEGAGGAGGHALPAGDAGRRAHRVVQVEGDPGGVALAAAADHVVALQVVAGPHAAVAEDAGVVVDRDDRVGHVGAPAGPARQLAGGDAVPVGEGQQQVVAGRRLLRVVLGRGLVGEQQLGQRGPAALDVVGRRGDRHAVLARPHAGRGEHPAADVDHAHPADPDRVHPLVVAEHRDVDAGVARGRPDRGARGHRQRPGRRW